MSPTMWTWRVIVPGLGLAASLLVFYDSTRAKSPLARPIEGLSKANGPAPGRPDRPRVVAEGRVAPRPGAEVTLGSETGGTVIGVPAPEKARVKKGDLLVEFLADEPRAALAEAEAKLAEADADLAFGIREFQRRAGSPTKADLFPAKADGARRDSEVAAARRAAALAAVQRCRSALARTRVTAPIDGVVLACFARLGEVAPPWSRLVTVCDLSRFRVEAEVDEFDAARIAPGDEVAITAEGHRGPPWKGTVEEVPDRVAERSVRPEDPGRPTDTRVLLVKVAIKGTLPLKLGQRVEVEIRPRP